MWPNNKKLAVMLSFDFDAETLWISRDKSNLNRPGTLSQGVFGANVGVPSILKLLEDEQIKGTFFVPGWVAEKYSSLIKEVVENGHELGHHGYLHEWVDPNEPAKEREVFQKGLAALEKVSGVRPVGYRSPAWETSENTIKLLEENNFLYSSNFMDDIKPYFIESQNKNTGLVELPVNWMLDDAPFFLFSVKPPSRPIASAKQVLTIWKEEFHSMYKRGGLFNLVTHPQIIGRPSRIDMLQEFIQFMRSYPDVWIATGEEIATYFKEKN